MCRVVSTGISSPSSPGGCCTCNVGDPRLASLGCGCTQGVGTKKHFSAPQRHPAGSSSLKWTQRVGSRLAILLPACCHQREPLNRSISHEGHPPLTYPPGALKGHGDGERPLDPQSQRCSLRSREPLLWAGPLFLSLCPPPLPMPCI